MIIIRAKSDIGNTKEYSLLCNVYQSGEGGERVTDLILGDLLGETARELQALEDAQHTQRSAASHLHNPTLENMYQRLEQMEVLLLLNTFCFDLLLYIKQHNITTKNDHNNCEENVLEFYVKSKISNLIVITQKVTIIYNNCDVALVCSWSSRTFVVVGQLSSLRRRRAPPR